MAGKIQYPAYATWKVTTEGDCEGRTVHDLGEHTGFIDDIAFELGSKAYYSLTFDLVRNETIVSKKPKPVDQVNVVLGIDSGTWDLHGKERANEVREILKGRGVVVDEGTYYASVILKKPEKVS